MATTKKQTKPDLSVELTLEQLASELDTYSSQISTQVRAINLGVLALVWTLLLKSSDVAPLMAKMPVKALLGIALSCTLSIASELCQYLCAKRAVDSTFDRAVDSDTKTAGYDPESLAYRAQTVFYRAKLSFTAVAAVAVAVLIARALLQ